jgi:16S rRNA (uracil1498-N3)-methyltransferase
MQIFYEPEILTNGGLLNEEESHHCIKVLRHSEGDIIKVINGKGVRVTGPITEASAKTCRISIENMEIEDEPVGKCHIAIAPTKSIDRFEWFLEKSTELGIDTITPLLCHQSERKHLRLQRLEKVLTAATKQSLRLWKPNITELTSIRDFLNSDLPESSKYIAYCDNREEQQYLPHLLKDRKDNDDVLILIGPEGDFSESEVLLAKEKGFISVSLGKNRLRTETAGIAACMAVKMTE